MPSFGFTRKGKSGLLEKMKIIFQSDTNTHTHIMILEQDKLVVENRDFKLIMILMNLNGENYAEENHFKKSSCIRLSLSSLQKSIPAWMRKTGSNKNTLHQTV